MQRRSLIWIGFVLGLVAGLVITLALWRVPSSTAASTGNLMVLCTNNCIYAPDNGGEAETYIDLLDTSNGTIWLYSPAAFDGKAKPIRWGTLVLGRPVTRFKENQ